MMTGRSIRTEDATIKTAVVEVKTLTVAGKQVTLAVFRQLIRADLIDWESVTFQGLPWGRVHYFWGECQVSESRGHLHIVWQLGNELRRDCLDRMSYQQRRKELKEIELNLLCAWTLAQKAIGVAVKQIHGQPFFAWDVGGNIFSPQMNREEREEFQKYVATWRGAKEAEAAMWDYIASVPSAFQVSLPDDDDPALAEVSAGLQVELGRIRSEINRVTADYSMRYQELEALPQLFIAV